MKSPVAKRSVVIGGHKTSVSLEEPFWTSMKEISEQRGMTLNQLVSAIDTNRQQGNLSSAIRLFVLDHFRSRAVGPTGLKVLLSCDEPSGNSKSAIEHEEQRAFNFVARQLKERRDNLLLTISTLEDHLN